MISFKKDFIFVHIPKTGGTAIQTVIAPYCLDTIITIDKEGGETQAVPYNKYNISKHSPLYKYKRKIPPDVFCQLKVITCIRNPWDRLISVYFSAHRQAPEWNLSMAKVVTLSEMEPLRFYLKLNKHDPENGFWIM